MRVKFINNQNPEAATSRLWFEEIPKNLKGVEIVDRDADIIVINKNDKKAIEEARTTGAKVGILVAAMGSEGLTKDSVEDVDFYIVTNPFTGQLIREAGKRVYVHTEFGERGTIKEHRNNDRLKIVYIGNYPHYTKRFSEVAWAMRRLSYDYEFIVISNYSGPELYGIKTTYVPWRRETYREDVSKADIGVCPSYNSYTEIGDPSTFYRGSRIKEFLYFGIPSVASPTLQYLNEFDTDSVYFAINKQGWLDGLELLGNAEIRNRMGRLGYDKVGEYNTEQASEKFREILLDVYER